MEITQTNYSEMQNFLMWIDHENIPEKAFRHMGPKKRATLEMIWLLHRLRVPIKRKYVGALRVFTELM